MTKHLDPSAAGRRVNVTGWRLRGEGGLQVSVAEVGVAALDCPPGLSIGGVLSIRAMKQINQLNLVFCLAADGKRPERLGRRRSIFRTTQVLTVLASKSCLAEDFHNSTKSQFHMCRQRTHVLVEITV